MSSGWLWMMLRGSFSSIATVLLPALGILALMMRQRRRYGRFWRAMSSAPNTEDAVWLRPVNGLPVFLAGGTWRAAAQRHISSQHSR